MFIAYAQGTEEMEGKSNLVRSLFSIVAYKGQGQLGSCALDSDLRTRDVASASH